MGIFKLFAIIKPKHINYCPNCGAAECICEGGNHD